MVENDKQTPTQPRKIFAKIKTLLRYSPKVLQKDPTKESFRLFEFNRSS